MKLDFATSNPHKLSEANITAKEFGIEFTQIHEPYPEIRDPDVSKVAFEGAKYVFERTKKEVIVEDTGLYIEQLNGFPGSYSAFVYKKIGCQGILKLLENKDRGAVFISAIGYCDKEKTRVFKGQVRGRISLTPRGEQGFGYDPIFTPEGYDKTFAEDPSLKAMLSHRNIAFREFCGWYIKTH